MRGESHGGSWPHASTTSTQAMGTGVAKSSTIERTGAEIVSATVGTNVNESRDQTAS